MPDRLSGIDDFRKVVVVTDEQSRTLPQLPRLRNVQVTTDRSLAEKTRIHVVISKIWFLEDSKAALVLQKSDTEKNEHTTELLYYEKQTDSQEPTGLGWKLMQSKVIASSARRYEDYEEF